MNDDIIKVSIVIGAVFGDEGKGKTVSWLCEENPKNSIVVRFNGGHQAGHTVNYKDTKHTFSSFGSGTFHNVPTIISKYCSVYPIALMNEYSALKDLGLEPKIHISDLSPVTTHLDYITNRISSKSLNNGTCGVGFGETMKRHESMYKLYYMDLFNDFILEQKMSNIKSYYDSLSQDLLMDFLDEKELEELELSFYESIYAIREQNIGVYDYVVNEKTHLIFEGAQGILLDKDFGLFPNVTYSNTTAKNIEEILLSIDKKINYLCTPTIYYISRTYQTRHGNGPMSNYDETMLPFDGEHNKHNKFQGDFRLGKFDGDLLNYAIKCNESVFKLNHTKNLVLTCADQHALPSEYLKNNNFNNIYISYGPDTQNMYLMNNLYDSNS